MDLAPNFHKLSPPIGTLSAPSPHSRPNLKRPPSLPISSHSQVSVCLPSFSPLLDAIPDLAAPMAAEFRLEFSAHPINRLFPMQVPFINRNFGSNNNGGMATATRLKHTNEDYRNAFAYFDMNKDGQITLQELESAMNKCGVYPTKLELRIIMNQMDKDKNGVVTFEEFASMMRIQEKEQMSQKQQTQKRVLHLSAEHPEIRRELLEQFRLFDKDNDGFILPEEMKLLVQELRLGKSFPAAVVEQLFKEADNDGDGKISFEEFVMAVI